MKLVHRVQHGPSQLGFESTRSLTPSQLGLGLRLRGFDDIAFSPKRAHFVWFTAVGQIAIGQLATVIDNFELAASFLLVGLLPLKINFQAVVFFNFQNS